MTVLKTPAALLSLLLLGWVSGYDRLQIALLVCLCRILGICQLGHLAVVTFVYLLVAEPFSGIVTNHWPGIILVLQARYGECLLSLPAVKYFGFLGRMLTGYLLYRAIRRLGRGHKIVVLHAAALASLFLCQALLQLGPVCGSVAIYGQMSFSFFFFYLCYIALENPNLPPVRFCVLYVATFWENSTSPRPIMDLTPATDRRERLTARCLKSALAASLLIEAGKLAQALLYATPYHERLLPVLFTPLPDITALGPTTSLFWVYSRWQIGLSILWTGFHRITNYFALFVFIECCHLMLGHEVPQRFVFPLQARSFADFYNCIMPYYVVVVNRIYLSPYFAALRKLGWNRYQAYDVALFGAIFSAGFTTHCLRDVHLVALIGAKNFLLHSLVTDASYCTLLFLAIRFAKIPRFIDTRLSWPLRFLILLSVYSIVIFFRVGGLFVSFEERLKFILCLLLGGP